MSLSGMGVYADGAILTFGMQFVGFVIAAILQTEVFYDVLGGINFLAIGSLSILSSQEIIADDSTEGASGIDKNTMFRGLYAVSRGWLLVFLAWRAHHRKGDARFDGVRDDPPMFFVYWMVQAVWVYCVSLPVLVLAASETATPAVEETVGSKIQYSSLMLAGMAFSIYIEIRSDIIKAQWVAEGRPGGFCIKGPWLYSRHPNYAAEILTWVYAALYAAGESGWSLESMLIASISPLFTMQILLNTAGTGVWNAEGKNLRRYYEHSDPSVAMCYDAYRKTVPPLFPVFLFPYEHLPLDIKRNFCFEWERYEYKPSRRGKTQKND